ncbi:MAG TPA: twin-arginine translocase TatA/TatE family subunit [Sporichthyaceae bacterium]|jgi:sec-independent protein translocase protein TatA|nr:twin-arginine translocase TatA/TatE family subunit [Sporichthyaceae bacterium]
MFRGALEPWHLVILAVVFMALFGAKRLPESAKSLGESLHIFKKTMRGPEEQAAPPTPQSVEQRAFDATKTGEAPHA